MTAATSRAHARAEIKDADRLRNSGNTANTAGGRATALTLMFDLIVPIGLFYGLRAAAWEPISPSWLAPSCPGSPR